MQTGKRDEACLLARTQSKRCFQTTHSADFAWLNSPYAACNDRFRHCPMVPVRWTRRVNLRTQNMPNMNGCVIFFGCSLKTTKKRQHNKRHPRGTQDYNSLPDGVSFHIACWCDKSGMTVVGVGNEPDRDCRKGNHRGWGKGSFHFLFPAYGTSKMSVFVCLQTTEMTRRTP